MSKKNERIHLNAVAKRNYWPLLFVVIDHKRFLVFFNSLQKVNYGNQFVPTEIISSINSNDTMKIIFYSSEKWKSGQKYF